MNFNKALALPASFGLSAAALGLFGALPSHAATSCFFVGGCAGGLSHGIFTLSLVSTGFSPLAGDRLQLQDAGGTAVVTFQPAPTRAFTGANSFTFDLSAPGNVFDTAVTGATGMGSLNVGLSSAAFAGAGSISNSGDHGMLTSVTTEPISFLEGISSATFTQSFGSTASSTVTLIQSSLSTNPTPENPVPGPLPIFGAAAAFRASRRMRHRVKAAF
jgi:hypothetical protein